MTRTTSAVRPVFAGLPVLLVLLPSASLADILTQQQVWLMAGQSNMIGYGTATADLPAPLQQPQPNVQIFTDAGAGWNNLGPGLGNQFGPEVTFGHDVAARLPGVRPVLLIKSPFGLGNLYNDWRSPNTGRGPAGPWYASFISLVQTAMASKPNAQIAGMIWMQGEGDAYNDPTMAASYAQDLRLFIASLRSDFHAPNMPFVIGQISNSSAWPYGATVRQAQVDVAQTLSNCYLVTTSDLPLSDNMHYTSQGQMELGSRFAQQALLAEGVPEPSPFVLLASGLAGLLIHVWWRRKQRPGLIS